MLRLVPCVTWTVGTVVLLACGGCSEGRPDHSVALRGQLLMNGQPLEVDGHEAALGWVALELHPIEAETEDIRTTTVAPDGSFDFGISHRRGVEPGRYRVVVYQYDPYPTDKLAGRFDPDRSQREITIAGGQTELVIDLGESP